MVHYKTYTQRIFGQQLTQAELAIYRLLITDLSNEEIAAKLFRSKRTVVFHCHNIYKKLGMKNRLALIVAHYENQAKMMVA